MAKDDPIFHPGRKRGRNRILSNLFSTAKLVIFLLAMASLHIHSTRALLSPAAFPTRRSAAGNDKKDNGEGAGQKGVVAGHVGGGSIGLIIHNVHREGGGGGQR